MAPLSLNEHSLMSILERWNLIFIEQVHLWEYQFVHSSEDPITKLILESLISWRPKPFEWDLMKVSALVPHLHLLFKWISEAQDRSMKSYEDFQRCDFIVVYLKFHSRWRHGETNSLDSSDNFYSISVVICSTFLDHLGKPFDMQSKSRDHASDEIRPFRGWILSLSLSLSLCLSTSISLVALRAID